MDTLHLQKTRQRSKHEEEEKQGAQSKQQLPTCPASPPSASSSPSHEFSFTISLHSSSTTTPPPPDKTAKSPPSIAIDLSPADDIFFHGHLLPLHLLSHLPVSPRTSTHSMDSFTLPIKDDHQQPIKGNSVNAGNTNNTNSKNRDTLHENQSTDQRKQGNKPKSFSLFGLGSKWRKGCEVKETEDKEKQKKKLRFEVSHVLKRYVKMIRPLLFFRGRRENLQFHRQPYSFSGNLSPRNRQELRGRRGEFSAPASMRTSPSNSGLLLATATLPSSTSDSTMEELQAAIQAAIAHCKNSIAVEEKLKC